MGVPDLMSITVDGARNFRAAIEAEERASFAWGHKWGWILDEYKLINKQIAELKSLRPVHEEETEPEDPRTTRPFCETEGHEYGFLAQKPGFKLEVFPSPSVTILPKRIPLGVLFEAVDRRVARRMKKYY